MFHPPGVLRGHAGDGVPAVDLRCLGSCARIFPCQFPAVRQFVNLGTQGIHAVKPPDVPLCGSDCPKSAGWSFLSPRLCGAAPVVMIPPSVALPWTHQRSPCTAVMVSSSTCRAAFEVPVGPLIRGLIGVGVLLDLLCGGLGGGQIIKPPQVHIPVHCRRVLGFHHMGCSSVHHCTADGRQHHPIQSPGPRSTTDTLPACLPPPCSARSPA